MMNTTQHADMTTPSLPTRAKSQSISPLQITANMRLFGIGSLFRGTNARGKGI